MAKSRSLGDILHYSNNRTYSDKQGEVAYLDGAPLRRPVSMPAGQRVIAAIIVIAAIALGAYFVNDTVIRSMREAQQAEQAIANNLARQASIDTIPHVDQLITLNDAGIKETFEEAGYTVYDASAQGDADELILYKLPSDMSIEEASAMYARGISGLTAVQATKLLNGSWQFVADRSGATSMVVRYADFSTDDPSIAVQNALQKAGYDPESITESGVDDSGNTYSMGTLDADGTTCTWKISALPLEDMFSISGMPEGGCYVGSRVTVAG